MPLREGDWGVMCGQSDFEMSPQNNINLRGKGTEVTARGLQHCSSIAACSVLAFYVLNSLAPSPTQWDTDKTLSGWRVKVEGII